METTKKTRRVSSFSKRTAESEKYSSEDKKFWILGFLIVNVLLLPLDIWILVTFGKVKLTFFYHWL